DSCIKYIPPPHPPPPSRPPNKPPKSPPPPPQQQQQPQHLLPPPPRSPQKIDCDGDIPETSPEKTEPEVTMASSKAWYHQRSA
ncbi:hypothetical protein OSTOST_18476, partial [Ostertagia ostertagi]